MVLQEGRNMDPILLGNKYDNIAQWWHTKHHDSQYGIAQLERALEFRADGGKALDVGCGAGGRFINMLQAKNYSVTGIDVSVEMIKLSQINNPQHQFIHADICSWESKKTFDLIVAWDSLFHLPLNKQKSVLEKFCHILNPEGVLMYSFGDDVGEHTDQWHNDTFYYSSIGIQENCRLLTALGLTITHLELDQYPEKHVYLIAKKRT
jgi:SAM-dependent methyltransferase